MSMLARLHTLPAFLWAAAALSATPADPFAFVAQRVCVDARDRAVAGDPVQCPNSRTVRIGEAIPYRRVDAGNWQAFTAYPVLAPGGERRVMVAKVFGGRDTSGSFGDLGARSGYDLLEVDDGLVSIIRTSDQGAGDQIFWRTADCARTNGWVLFPPGLEPGQHGELRSTLKITKGPSVACPRALLAHIAPDYTVWDRPADPVRYTSGKLLDSIVSMHFAYGDPASAAHDDDSMEMFYFTQAYGYTRWEAWETPAGCRRRAARGGSDPADTCRPYPVENCSGANTATFFGKPYLRLDCRDDSFVGTDRDRPFDPLVSDAAPGDVVNRNLLANGTFFEGTAGWTASGKVAAHREPGTNNAVVTVPPKGKLTQRFLVPTDGAEGGQATVRFGARLQAEAAPTAVRVALALDTDHGPELAAERLVDVSGPAERSVRVDVTLPVPPGREASGEVIVEVAGQGRAWVDDVFVTPVGSDHGGSPPAPR